MIEPHPRELYEALVLSYQEDFSLLDNVYAFTWNPDPVRYSSKTPSDQYESLLHYIYKNYKIFGKFVFIPELTLNGYIHIHGIFTMKDRISFYKTFLPIIKNIGFVVIKPCTNIDGWINYLIKDIKAMSEILREELPIPLTSDNIELYKKLHKFETKSRKLKLQLNIKPFKRGKAYNLEEFFKKK